MKKSLFVYYSQAGNTRKALEKAASIFIEKGHAVEWSEIGKGTPPLPTDWDFMVLGAPMFFEVEPLIVRRFLEALPEFPGRPAALVTTYANLETKRPPDARFAANLAELLRRKGLDVIGKAALVCADSSDIMVRSRNNRTRPNEEDWRLFSQKIEALAEELAVGKNAEAASSGFRPGRLYGKNQFTYTMVPRMRLYRQNCNRCGACVRRCPMDNITMDPEPRFGRDCMKCSLCENNCSRQAIRPRWRLLAGC